MRLTLSFSALDCNELSLIIKIFPCYLLSTKNFAINFHGKNLWNSRGGGGNNLAEFEDFSLEIVNATVFRPLIHKFATV